MDKNSLTRSLTAALRRHYWAALATFASVMGGAALYLLVTPPVYESSSRLMVEAKEVSVSDLGQAINDPDSNSEVNPLATQAELLTSEQVLRRALNKVFAASSDTDETRVTENQPSIGTIRRGLDVKIVPATNILELSLQYTEPVLTARILDAIVESAVEDNIEVIRAKASTVRAFLEESIPQQEARLREAETAEGLYRQENGIVSLPEQTQNLIDSLSQLEDAERTLVAQLQASEERVGLLQEVTGFAQINNAYEAIRLGQDPELNELRSRFTALETAILESQARLGPQHPKMAGLLEEREALVQLYAQKLPNAVLSRSQLAGGAASNPLSQEMVAQYIAGEIENQALVEQLAAIERDRQILEARLSDIPRLQQPLAALTRDRQSAEESLQLLLSKLEEARIAEAQLVNNIRVMGPAEIPEDKAAPSIPAVLVIAAVTGLVLASGIILLLEAVNNTLRDAEEAKHVLKLPILGTLPKLPSNMLVSECQPGRARDECLNDFLDNPLLIEPYHSLLQAVEAGIAQSEAISAYNGSGNNGSGNNGSGNNGSGNNGSGNNGSGNNGAGTNDPDANGKSTNGLSAEGSGAFTPTWLSDNHANLSSQARSKIIVVSSVFVGEGKSAVVAHLAAVAAMLCRRTLIIDANFDQPVQNQFFSLPDAPGLADVVDGSCSFLDAVQATTVENLSVLTHGTLPARPSVIPEKPGMRHLLEEAAFLYDLIIIEASPTALASDALTFSRYINGLVLVARANFMPREKMRQVIEGMRQRGASLLGAVFNETQTPWEEDAGYSADLGPVVPPKVAEKRSLVGQTSSKP